MYALFLIGCSPLFAGNPFVEKMRQRIVIGDHRNAPQNNASHNQTHDRDTAWNRAHVSSALYVQEWRVVVAVSAENTNPRPTLLFNGALTDQMQQRFLHQIYQRANTIGPVLAGLICPTQGQGSLTTHVAADFTIYLPDEHGNLIPLNEIVESSDDSTDSLTSSTTSTSSISSENSNSNTPDIYAGFQSAFDALH